MKSSLVLPLLLFLSARVEGASQKKGVAVPSGQFRCGDFDVLRNVAWWYDWYQTPTYQHGCPNEYLDNRVAMVWAWRNGDDLPLRIPSHARAILGFNEPNFRAQANISPQEAARNWRELQNQAGDRILVSPSAAPCGDTNMCMSNGDVWFEQFFQACSDCKVDFLATHGYWCDANIMMGYLEGLWNKFHKKIWLTEFACPQRPSVEVQLNYLKELLPRLEAADYVEKYAWFATRFDGAGWVPQEARLLERESSQLTELGKFYMNF